MIKATLCNSILQHSFIHRDWDVDFFKADVKSRKALLSDGNTPTPKYPFRIIVKLGQLENKSKLLLSERYYRTNYCLVSQTEYFEEKVAEKLTGNLKLSESDSDASGTALVNVKATETDEAVPKTGTK